MARNYAALPYEYLEEMEALNDAEFGRLTRALLAYSMTGEPIALCGNERFYAKRVMAQEDRFKTSYQDAIGRRSEAGKKGAVKRWDSKNSNAMASDSKNSNAIPAMASDSKNGYTETKTETKTETDTLPSDDGRSIAQVAQSPVAVVVSAYANKINANPGDRTISELKGFVQTMGADCCLRAIDIALDERKATWSYIRGILRSKLEQGVHSLAEWDALEEKRQQQIDAKRKGFAPLTVEEPNVDPVEHIGRMQRLLEQMKGGADDGQS